MRILLTTGILPPDIGGPANYVTNLSRQLRSLGHEVTVITYGKPAEIDGVSTVGIKRHANKLGNLLRYTWQVLKAGRRADFILTFDIMSAGFPTILANHVLKKDVVLRLGGDFFWERDLNEERVFCTIEDYYRNRFYRRGLAFRITRYMMRRLSLLIFSTSFLEKIYLEAYPSLKGKTVVINNPYPDMKKAWRSDAYSRGDGCCKFIFVGRLIKLKNLKALIEIFHKIALDNHKASLEIYGDGPEREILNHMVVEKGMENNVKIFSPVSHEEVMEKIGSSYACILPSLSEVSPNFGLECLKLNKPLIITRFNGLQEIFGHYAVQIDPFDHKQIKEKILEFIQAEGYQDLTPDIQGDELIRTWREVTEETLWVVKRLYAYDSSFDIGC